MTFKKKPSAVDEQLSLVPVSQTHRVVTVAADVRSSLEQRDEARQEALREIENGLLQESLTVLSGSMKFADIDPELTEPDEAFMEKYGHVEDPMKLFRLMKYGQMKGSEAPVGLILAQKTAIGILKARAADKSEARPLSVNVQIVQSMPSFEKIYETEGDK